MNDYFSSKRVVVTGGAGFLGTALVRRLVHLGCRDPVVVRSADYDLREPQATRALLEATRPELVFHLAANVGGIGANRAHPGEFLHDNLAMGLHLIEACRVAGVEKIVVVGTVCAYPKNTSVPFRESDLWEGYPEETNAPYGLAKKMLLAQLQAYRDQYGTRGIYLLPANLYGPGDDFDLERGHVIPALIRKCVEAAERGDEEVVCWGSGRPTREFLYVDDCAAGLCMAAERYDGADPVNLGSGREVSIADLAALVAGVTGFNGRLVWDATHPDGQPRRSLDTSRAVERFGFTAGTRLEDGLQATVDWFLAHRRPV